MGDQIVDLETKGVFDELVVDHWLHVEQMDERFWWMRVGNACVEIRVNEDGSVSLEVERDVYESVVEVPPPEQSANPK